MVEQISFPVRVGLLVTIGMLLIGGMLMLVGDTSAASNAMPDPVPPTTAECSTVTAENACD
jgi:hypothetical protein